MKLTPIVHCLFVAVLLSGCAAESDTGDEESDLRADALSPATAPLQGKWSRSALVGGAGPNVMTETFEFTKTGTFRQTSRESGRGHLASCASNGTYQARRLGPQEYSVTVTVAASITGCTAAGTTTYGAKVLASVPPTGPTRLQLTGAGRTDLFERTP